LAADAFKFEGGEELRRALKGIERKFLDTMAKAIDEEAHKVMAAGIASAPKLSGELASATNVVVSRSRGQVQGAASFLKDRAAAVHEGVHWGRKIPTKGFHWFANAALDWEPAAAKRIVQRLQDITGEGGGSVPAGRGKKTRPSAPQRSLTKTRKSATKSLRRATKKALKATRKLAKSARKLTKRRRRR
jgi:hypothetical protein